jgi:hypothetical protein
MEKIMSAIEDYVFAKLLCVSLAEYSLNQENVNELNKFLKIVEESQDKIKNLIKMYQYDAQIETIKETLSKVMEKQHEINTPKN